MLTLQACAATTTGTPFPPGGGPEGLPVQAPSSFSSHLYQHSQPCQSFRAHNQSLATVWSLTGSQEQQQQQQQQRPSRKRSCEDIAPSQYQSGLESAARQECHEPSSTADSSEASLRCPHLQAQQLYLPRKRSQPSAASMHEGAGVGPHCPLDPNTVKANFVDCLVDTAAIVIESIWPPLPGALECPQKQKGLPLRTFIQETLKRSRSSYSTLQTALFYLYKIRNKVPCAYLKRRQDQLYHTHQILSATQPSSGLMTPPASPHHLQHLQDFSNLQGPDYFSLRGVTDIKPVLPSPLSSTCSLASTSPASGYSPCSSASPSSTTSSPASSSSPCSVSSSTSSISSSSSASSASSSSSSSSSQSNRIIYCGRRTFLASLMVASKYLQDRNYSNKAWAKISGLSVKEINANELIFLKLIDYSLFVSHDTFMRWTALLVAHGQEATRKFMQTSDAAHASAFAMRSLSSPPMVLNGSHIRYGPSKVAPSVFKASSTSCLENDEATVSASKGAKNACDEPRSAKIARTDAYSDCHTSSKFSNSFGEAGYVF